MHPRSGTLWPATSPPLARSSSVSGTLRGPHPGEPVLTPIVIGIHLIVSLLLIDRGQGHPAACHFADRSEAHLDVLGTHRAT